ncbi:MAG: CPBP family intramembrane metalloprotease [Alphaproteobacteria bacterium]|nr:CPBP family intramembrane metalloprotease [Alphaproteobacteria bacterium]
MTETVERNEAMRAITEHARRITRGSYEEVNDLMQFADTTRNPPDIAELAETFGMMSVKVEAREFAWKQTVEVLEQKKEELQESLKIRGLSSRLVLWFVFGVSLYVFLTVFALQTDQSDPVRVVLLRWFSSLFVISQIIMMVALILKSGYPLSDYGLTLKNLRRSLMESVLVSTAVILLLAGLKFWIQKEGWAFGGRPFIEEKEFGTMFLYLYVLNAPVQEFLARGVLQSSIGRILMGKRRMFWAVVSTSMIFGMLHTVYSLPVALITLLASLLWGWLYIRHQTIVGVSICHLLVGLAAILLGYWDLLVM